ncbi:penicillin acylase family protein [Gynuella sp.]|uniref:penicillin acylase family protein n=1 Tax=Gynuella sp. TaxID=2969146 RepID=UPI003D0A1BDE
MTHAENVGMLDKIWGALVGIGVIGKAVFTRPTPKTMAQRLAMLPTDNLPVAAPVNIYWNKYQVPFVEAESQKDLAVALGLVHGHLRLAQIEIMRRLAYGRMAEMIGPMGFEIDRSLRLLDIGKAVPEIIANMDSTTREWAESFVKGLNHLIKHTPELPHEFAILGIRPELWTLTDLITLARVNSSDISWLVWLKLLKARRKLPRHTWETLWPRLVNADGPTGYAAEGMFGGEHVLAARTRSGSNSSAIAGSHTTSGYAAIVSDPHLPMGVPSPCFVVGAKAPGYHLVGAMMPGMPFFVLGRNEHIAWGGTSLHAQGSDLFDVSEFPDSRISEEYQPVRARWSRSRRLRIRRTDIGPIVSDGPLMKVDRPTAMRWQGHRPSDEIAAMQAVATATSWEEFHQALKPFAVSGLNMVFAGGKGQRVGHCLAAHLPRRPNDTPEDVILPASAADSWGSIADTTAMPVRVDPEQGFVASANERPEGSDFPIGYFFSPKDRSQRLAEIFSSKEKLSMDDLRASQTDVAMPGVLPLRDLFLQRAALSAAKGDAQQHVLTLLTGWDGGYQAGRVEPMAFEMLLAEVVKRLGLHRPGSHYHTVWMTHSLLKEDLQAVDPTHLAGVIHRALKVVAKKITRYRKWGNVHRLRIEHMFHHLPFIGRRYRFADLPASGGANTVHKTGHPLVYGPHTITFGSCTRHISDLSDPDANYFVLQGGQDGWIGSENFVDQLSLWQSGDYMRIPLRIDTIRETFPHKSVLKPSA